MRVLVTGAAGSIGSALVPRLREQGHEVFATDLRSLDVTYPDGVWGWFFHIQPDLIYHLAGAKHAPEGEVEPLEVARVNTIGTANILDAAGAAKVILASTCKACDPETAYGASKLIAERMVLNAGGVVVRFYNVRETSGNVFRLWEQLPESEPIPWTDCSRYFVSLEQVVDLLLKAADLPSGRYAPDPGDPQHMLKVAHTMYPDRKLISIPRRRGDRVVEPLKAACERIDWRRDGVLKISSPHDPA